MRAEIRIHYGHHWRTVTRPAILRRAGGVFQEGRYLGGARCERCGISDPIPLSVWQRSTLDVAHLVIPPGEPGHDAEDNLACLCPQDHRRHDYRTWNARCKETRLDRKDGARPIVAAGILEIR